MSALIRSRFSLSVLRSSSDQVQVVKEEFSKLRRTSGIKVRNLVCQLMHEP